MPDQDVVNLPGSGAAGERFIALGRAPKVSRPRIIIEHEQPMAILALDIGVGEPSHERRVLEIGRLGGFVFPEIVPAGELLSVRGRELPVGTVTVRVEWEDPA